MPHYRLTEYSRNLRLATLLLLGALIAACGGGGSPATPTVPDRESDDDDPVVEQPTIEQESIAGFLFFPMVEGAQWYYDNGDVVTLGPAKQVAGETIFPMRHSLESWVTEEFFYTRDDELYYGGVYGNIIELPVVGQLAGEFKFNKLWPIYNQLTGAGSAFSCPGSFNSIPAVPGYEDFPVPMLCLSTTGGSSNRKLIDVAQFGPVPAVRLDLTISLPPLAGLETSIWLSPGLGIVARELGSGGNSQSGTLQKVDGLTAPLTFAYGLGKGLNQNPVQLQWFGNVVTDNQWQVEIAYATRQKDWLQVEFDSTGSWRASLTGNELPWGLHAALITLSKPGQTREIPVSVLVQ